MHGRPHSPGVLPEPTVAAKGTAARQNPQTQGGRSACLPTLLMYTTQWGGCGPSGPLTQLHRAGARGETLEGCWTVLVLNLYVA